MWDVYSGLDLYVKNLLTSLRAVSQLQNLAIRERHWVQLIRTTQVRKFIEAGSYFGAKPFFWHDRKLRLCIMTIILLN